MIELHPDEKSLREVRRYWLPITARGIGLIIIGIIPLLVLMVLDDPESQLLSKIRPYLTYAYLLATIWFLFAWMALAIAWVDYYLDILIITSKRVIDIEQLGLFSRSFSEMPIENIEDIKVEIHGFLASALDFGNLVIQSAGENREFLVETIHHPHRIKDILSKQYNVFQDLRTGTPGEQ